MILNKYNNTLFKINFISPPIVPLDISLNYTDPSFKRRVNKINTSGFNLVQAVGKTPICTLTDLEIFNPNLTTQQFTLTLNDYYNDTLDLIYTIGSFNLKTLQSLRYSEVRGFEIYDSNGLLVVDYLPDQAGNEGKFLSTDGTNAIWVNKSYTHEQNISSTEWIVNHNLGFKPNVRIVNSAGDNIETVIEDIDDNNLKIFFNNANGGKAFCS